MVHTCHLTLESTTIVYKYPRSCRINLLHKIIYFQFGAYQLEIELLQALFIYSKAHPSHLMTESAQAWVLHTLSSSHRMNGEPYESVKKGLLAVELVRKTQNKLNAVVGIR